MEPERSERYMVTSKLFLAPCKTSTKSEKFTQFTLDVEEGMTNLFLLMCTWEEVMYTSSVQNNSTLNLNYN